MVVSNRQRDLRKLMEVVVVLTNTAFLAIPTLVEGESYYVRWWHWHLINRVAGVLLVPVAVLASFFIALFIQVGTSDRGFRVAISILGLFFIGSGLWKTFGNGLSWASIGEGSLLFWGLALVLAACMGKPNE